MSSALRWLLSIGLALAAVLILGGDSCGRLSSPQLVTVLDLAPREVEVGDRVAITGQGFPPGKAARVTFRGTLHRPGERAERGAEIVVAGNVMAPDRIEMVVGEETQALFCGAADRALHTTFEGDVEVAFAAAARGAPPVAGVLSRATFDVRPAARAGADAERDAEGERVLSWLGVHVSGGVAAGAGLAVESVEAASRADRAGLAAGDVIASFDGVRVASPGDVLPAPGEHEASVGVRRSGDAGEATRTIAVEGLRRAPPVELFAAALVVLAALAVIVLFGAPTRPAIASALQRIVARVRARVGSARGLGRALAGAALESLPPANASAAVDAFACALLLVMPFGQYLVAAQIDVGLLFTAAATALASAALVASGNAWRGARAAAHVAWQHAPAAASVACVVVSTGSMRMREVMRAQGGYPWDWLAFRSPAALAALLLLVSCALVEPEVRPAIRLAAWIEGDPPALAERRGAWLGAACRAHRIVIAGLTSALFLGGWLLPGVPAAAQDARPVLQLAGAAWLLAKTWGVVVAVAWLRWAMPPRRMVERTRTTAFRAAPAAVAVLALTAAWTWWSPAPAAQRLVSGALVAAAGLCAAALAHRVRHGLAAGTGNGHVTPFL